VATGSLEAAEWWQLLEGLGLSGSAYNIASHCTVAERGEASWALRLDAGHANLFNERHAGMIARALSRVLARRVSVPIDPGPVDSETPAQRAARLEAERLAEARRQLEADPRVRSLLEAFEGELLDDSVTVHSTVNGSDQKEVNP
jgi:DNA polymerase-3 subunit gamma/tau